MYKLRIRLSISSSSCPFELNIKPKYFVRPMYSKTLLSNVTLGQNHFFRLKCNTYRFHRIKCNVITYTKVEHTSNICCRLIALGAKRHMSSVYIT